jgi:cyclic pyranopterin phosphate synthase
MPEKGIRFMSERDILSFEEIYDFVKVAVGSGIHKVRLTGGEPLMRKGIIQLVEMLASIPGIKDLGMTTNGILLKRYAGDLAKAGLDRVNISLDSLDAGNFHYITRVGKLENVLDGIVAAREAGLNPVKINCVIKDKGLLDEHAIKVREFGKEHGMQVRFIKEMDLESGVFSIVKGGDGGKCHICNRLRLTPDGFLKPCLFSEVGYNIREHGYREALDLAVGNKPERGSLNNINNFYNIGG